MDDKISEDILWDLLNDITEATYRETGFQPSWTRIDPPVYTVTLPAQILDRFTLDELTQGLRPLVQQITDYHQYFILAGLRIYSNPQVLIQFIIQFKRSYLGNLPQEVIPYMLKFLNYKSILYFCATSHLFANVCDSSDFWESSLLNDRPHLKNTVRLTNGNLTLLKNLDELITEGGDVVGFSSNGISSGLMMDISSGDQFNVFLATDGRVYLMGTGELGLGQYNRTATSPALLDIREKIVQISSGEFDTIAVAKSGNVYTFGLDNTLRRESYTPYKVPGITNVVQASYGRFNYFCVTQDGDLYMGGNSVEKDLMLGTPTKLDLGRKIIYVSAGYNIVTLIDEKQHLYIGYIRNNLLEVVPVVLPKGEQGVRQAVCNMDDIYYISNNNKLYQSNKIYRGRRSELVPGTEQMKIKQVACQGHLMAFITFDDEFYSYIETRTEVPPVQDFFKDYGSMRQLPFAPGSRILKISCGYSSVLALSSSSYQLRCCK